VYKHLVRVLATIQGLLLFISMAHAQSVILDLPRASQRAVVTQRIGITDVSISYHRPLVNKRKIWGGVVPYGDVWRAGANENTTIAFTDPVNVEGKTLPKGTYGLHMIPGENEWTLIFCQKLHFLGQLYLRSERRCFASRSEAATGGLPRSAHL